MGKLVFFITVGHGPGRAAAASNEQARPLERGGRAGPGRWCGVEAGLAGLGGWLRSSCLGSCRAMDGRRGVHPGPGYIDQAYQARLSAGQDRAFGPPKPGWTRAGPGQPDPVDTSNED